MAATSGGSEPDSDGASGSAAGATSAVQQESGELLSEVARLRRQARSARHAYWFPLVIFGVLTCASVPFYIQGPARGGAFRIGLGYPFALGGLPGLGGGSHLAYYWLAAIAVGLTLTGLWYRRHGRKVGVVTPSRGYLITGAVLVVLSLLPWLFLELGHSFLILMPGDLFIRGTFPLVIIALGFWMLAWAERSWALLAIVAVYTASALLASLYNIENVLFRLGWHPAGSQWRLTALPNVLLPALVLLIAGAGAFLVQRRAPRLT